MDVREETMLNGGSRTDRAIIEQLYKTGAGGGGSTVTGVLSFNRRTGIVSPEAGDYNVDKITGLKDALDTKVNLSDKATASDIAALSDSKWMTPKATRDMIGTSGGGGGTGGVAGVASFNGRIGNVIPEEGDYTPEQIGALPIEGGTLLGSLAVGESAIASGEASFAQGGNAVIGDTRTPTEASGLGSHAEGFGSEASETASHAEGFLSKASANYSHAEGRGTMASGSSSHAEGSGTTASGSASHAEGGSATDGDVTVSNTASGTGSHAEGSGTTASGSSSHAEGFLTKASYSYAHAEGRRTVSEGNSSHAEGYLTTASGSYSHAEGAYTIASGSGSHAEGNRTSVDDEYLTTEASGNSSHAEGAGTKSTGTASHSEGARTAASGNYSHVEGYQTIASAQNSHAEGHTTVASAPHAHAEGHLTKALGYRSHAANNGTIAHSCETAIGRFNVDSGVGDDNSTYANASMLVVGSGANDASRSNILRITTTGIFGSATFNSSGADYAEMFEWEDGNPNGEDRVGRFVTLNGSKIRIATGSDDFILGIVSATPSVVGDNHSDQWKGMYERDIFGRVIFDEGNINDISKEDEETFERIERINPAYNNTERYIARSDRPEWSAIGLLGKLIVIDDGTCQVNGWCRPTLGGLATESSERTKYRVMERLDDSHVLILIL